MIKTSSTAFEKIQQTIHAFSPLSDENWQLLEKQLQPKSFKKNDFYIKEGSVCDYIGFLNKGIARVYYTIEGKEITSYFNTENRNIFVCSFVSFLSRKASFETIHFLEDIKLLILDYMQLQDLYEARPKIQKSGRLIAEYNYVLSIERIY